MSDITIDTKRTSTLTILGGDRVTVTAAGEIEGESMGITSLGTSNAVMVDGYVHSTGAGGIGIRLLGYSAVQVGSSGRIFGDGFGLRLTDGRVTNAGTITSNGDAINGGPELRIVNSGTIQGSQTGIRLNGPGNTVTNSGTIKGGVSAISGGDSGMVVINTGHLEGRNAVLFGVGRDLYDGRGGTAAGTIDLNGGNDTAYGGAQAETFHGGEGDDYVDGEAGSDTVIYTGGADIRLDLRRTDAQTTGQGLDTLIGIENIRAADGADLLIGNESDNAFYGNVESDTLEGGLGNDRLDGGAGIDRVRYTGSAAATVSLALSGPQDTGGNGRDTLVDVENLEGGSGADRFTGNNQHNRLIGHGGRDTLQGGRGNDTLEGGDDSDTAVFSGARHDYIISSNDDGSISVEDQRGQDGEDVLKSIRVLQFADKVEALTNTAPSDITLSKSAVGENAGLNSVVARIEARDAEGDTVQFSLTDNIGGWFKIQGNNLVLAKPLDYETQTKHTIVVKAMDAFGAESTRQVSVDVIDGPDIGEPPKPGTVLWGTPKRDALTGSAADEVVYGLGSDDRLRGEAGDDRLHGGKGKDTLRGGSGKDIFVFETRPHKKTNLDKIVDFNVTDDTIWLDNAIFKKLGKGTELKPGKLNKKFFAIGDERDANDYLFYDKTGGLFYDQDGSGAKAAVQIAMLSKNLKKITSEDFLIV